MKHTDDYYKSLGICKRCGAQAGVLIPLKILDEMNIACVIPLPNNKSLVVTK